MLPHDAVRGAVVTVGAEGVNIAVLARLMDLHHRGFLTRTELEREFGVGYDVLADIDALPLWYAA